MILPILTLASFEATPADRVRAGFASLLKPPVSMNLTLAKGSVKILWEIPSSTSERFRIQFDAESYEFRGVGSNFIEIDWIARQYETGTMPAKNIGPFGEIDGSLSSAYPFIARPKNLDGFLSRAKGKKVTASHLQFVMGNEKLDVVFGATNSISKFTQTISGRDQVITRDWVVTGLSRRAIVPSVTPPLGMVPMGIADGSWNFDSAEPMPDLPVSVSGVSKRLSQLLGPKLTIVELLSSDSLPNADLPLVARRHKATMLVIGGQQPARDPNGIWQRAFARGGYPVVLLLDRDRRIHMAFQGVMPEMVSELETYLKGR